MIDLSRNGAYPNALTSYDVWKFAAIILMIIDHMGFLFFPDESWMRMLGRLCIPIWFFLIGYAKTREIPTLWIMAAVLVDLPDPLIGLNILPLSILFTFLLVRVLLDPMMRQMRLNPQYFWISIIILAVMAPVTNMFTEYGTLGLLLALLGLQARRPGLFKGRLRPLRVEALLFPMIGLAFLVEQSLRFGFSFGQIGLFAIGTALVLMGLKQFEPKAYKADPNQWQVRAMMFAGRYSLEIYVLHLVFFKLFFAIKVFL